MTLNIRIIIMYNTTPDSFHSHTVAHRTKPTIAPPPPQSIPQNQAPLNRNNRALPIHEKKIR